MPCALVSRHFIGIQLNQPQSAVTDVVCLIDAIADLDGSDEEITGDHKGEIALYGRFENPTDNTRLIDPRDRGGDLKLGIGFVEQFHADSGKRSGSCLFEKLKEWKIKRDLAIAEHPRFPRHR